MVLTLPTGDQDDDGNDTYLTLAIPSEVYQEYTESDDKCYVQMETVSDGNPILSGRRFFTAFSVQLNYG